MPSKTDQNKRDEAIKNISSSLPLPIPSSEDVQKTFNDWKKSNNVVTGNEIPIKKPSVTPPSIKYQYI